MATLKMNNGVIEADVHPDEVENYKLGGWTKGSLEVEDEPEDKPGTEEAKENTNATKTNATKNKDKQ